MPFLGPVITGVGSILAGASTFLSGGTFLAGVAKFGLGLAAQYAIGELIGKPSTPAQVSHLQTKYGENLPRTVVLGKRALVGHHVYRNAFGKGNRTVQDAYVLSHFRINDITRVRVDGVWRTLGGVEDAERGFRIQGIDGEIWVKVHKGALNHAADTGLVARANPVGRWTVDHRLAGLAYAVVTSQLDRDKLPQPWEALFEVEGLCYDWRRDDTTGGAGAQRWSDPTTWGPSSNPIVQAYNLERGFYLGTQLIVGKGASTDRLPLANWTLAANIADEFVDDGPRYTSAYIASAGQGIAHADNMQPILAACASSWYEGPEGEYPIAGANQAIIATITDGDILIEEDDRISLKRTRSELVNTIAGSYSSPDAFYDSVPLATRTDAVAFAADRERLAASIPYEAVTDPKVGDRLNDIALRASRYQGNAEICLRPKFLGLKVGQWIRWQSNKADGFDKTFQIVNRRLGPIGPKACRAVYLTLQEVGEGIFDPTAYSTLPPDASGVGAPDYQSELVNFAVGGIVLTASTGSKRAGIRASWNALEDMTITFIDLEYGPIAATGQVPTVTATEQAKADQTREDLFQGVLSSSLWAVRYILRSSPSRAFFPSPWFEVSTLEARLGDNDVYLPGMVEEINEHVLENLAPLNINIRDLIETERNIAREATNQDAGQYLDKQQSLTQVTSVYKDITADYQSLVTAMTGPGSAIVQRLDTLDATIPGLATTTALNLLAVTVTSQGDTITSQGTAITGLTSSLASKADASAVNSLSTIVTSQGNAIIAQGVAITGVQTVVGGYSSTSLLRLASVTTEAGASSTLGLTVGSSGTGATSTAALLMSSIAGGKSMIGLVADMVYMTDGAGNKAYPFVFSGGVMRVNNAYIGGLTSTNILTKSLDANVVMQNGTVITDLIAFNQIFAYNFERATKQWPASGGYDDVLSFTCVNPNPTAVQLILNASTNFPRGGTGQSTIYGRVVRRVGGSEVVLWPATILGTASTGSSGPFPTGAIPLVDDTPIQGTCTYVFQLLGSGASTSPTASGILVGNWGKR